MTLLGSPHIDSRLRVGLTGSWYEPSRDGPPPAAGPRDCRFPPARSWQARAARYGSSVRAVSARPIESTRSARGFLERAQASPLLRVRRNRRQDPLGDAFADLPARAYIGSKMDAGPHAGVRRLCRHGSEFLFIVWKEACQRITRGRREACVCCRIARMVRSGKQGLELRIHHERPHRPVGVLRVEAGNGRIVEGNALQRQDPGCFGRLVGQAVFEHLAGRLLVPEMPGASAACAPFPEPGRTQHGGRSLDRFKLLDLRLHLRRVIGRWRRWPQRIGGRQNPGFPGADRHRGRISPAPHALSGGNRAGPFHVGAVGFAAGNHPRANVVAQGETSFDVARERQARVELGPSRFPGQLPEKIGLIRKQVCEHVRSRGCDRRVVRGIGRSAWDRQGRYQARVEAARAGPHVGFFAVQGRHGRVMDCDVEQCEVAPGHGRSDTPDEHFTGSNSIPTIGRSTPGPSDNLVRYGRIALRYEILELEQLRGGCGFVRRRGRPQLLWRGHNEGPSGPQPPFLSPALTCRSGESYCGDEGQNGNGRPTWRSEQRMPGEHGGLRKTTLGTRPEKDGRGRPAYDTARHTSTPALAITILLIDPTAYVKTFTWSRKPSRPRTGCWDRAGRMADTPMFREVESLAIADRVGQRERRYKAVLSRRRSPRTSLPGIRLVFAQS